MATKKVGGMTLAAFAKEAVKWVVVCLALLFVLQFFSLVVTKDKARYHFREFRQWIGMGGERRDGLPSERQLREADGMDRMVEAAPLHGAGPQQFFPVPLAPHQRTQVRLVPEGVTVSLPMDAYVEFQFSPECQGWMDFGEGPVPINGRSFINDRDLPALLTIGGERGSVFLWATPF